MLPQESVTLAAGIFTACLGTGGFLSSSFARLVGTIFNNPSPRLPILAGMVIAIILTII